MSRQLTITPRGHLALLEQSSAKETAAEPSKQLVSAFSESTARGLLHLATSELQAHLPARAGLCPVVRLHLSDPAVPDAGSRSRQGCCPPRRRLPRSWRPGSCRLRP